MHPYENRLRWRKRLPWFLINWGIADKGENCKDVNAEHHWYKMNGRINGCYYCKETTVDLNWKSENDNP